MRGFILYLFHCCFLVFFTSYILFSQIQINSDATPEQMAEILAGDGIEILSVSYTGADVSSCHFYGATIPEFVMEEGIALTSGAAYLIPGPNTNATSGANWGGLGDVDLSNVLSMTTYDATSLELIIKPEGDSLFFNFAFGSDEYNEFVNGTTGQEGCAIFISGPNPVGGNYEMENIALVPGTNVPVAVNNVNNGWSYANVIPNGPCINCAYYLDNTYGLEIGYDGFTTKIDSSILVYPDSLYYIKIVVADVVDHIIDSGIFLEENSLHCNLSEHFYSFIFDTINNPGLIYSVNGNITSDSIFLAVPFGTDITGLIASFDASPGAEVFVDDILQQSGITVNDFSSPLIYKIIGINSDEKDWVVVVNILPCHLNSIINYSFEAVNNPSLDEDIIGLIDSNTIHLAVPYGMVLNGFIASFSLSEFATAFVDGTVQNSGATPNNFYSMVSYKIQAENGENKFYEVFVDVMENHENEIEFFAFDNAVNPSLNTDIIGQIGDSTIHLYAPASTDLSALIATYMLSLEADAYVNGLIQQSTVTSNNFTNPVFYTIVAENGDEKNWLVTVHLETGISTKEKVNILVYPNPAKNKVYIDCDHEGLIKLISLNGKIFYLGNWHPGINDIDVSELPEGIYYIEFKNNRNRYFKKILVRR